MSDERALPKETNVLGTRKSKLTVYLHRIGYILPQRVHHHSVVVVEVTLIPQGRPRSYFLDEAFGRNVGVAHADDHLATSDRRIVGNGAPLDASCSRRRRVGCCGARGDRTRCARVLPARRRKSARGSQPRPPNWRLIRVARIPPHQCGGSSID